MTLASFREFTCTYKGDLCSRGDCTRYQCAQELEDQEKASATLTRKVANIDRPAWRGSIRIGRRYTLRNGAVVIITGREPLGWIGADGKKMTIDVWIGNYLRTATKITWQLDGWHAPECGVRPHELDIVATAP